jgi:hypothetical protein
VELERKYSGLKFIIPNIIFHQNIWGIISQVPDLCKQADPTTYITSECPPFFILHGTLDSIIPTQQSVDLAAAIIKEIGQDKVTLTLLYGAGHGGVPVTLLNGTIHYGSPFGNATNMNKIFAFLNKCVK